MAHFYGTIKGSRGEASRLGTKASGLRTTTASWQGAVTVNMVERNGVDYVEVWLTKWHGAGTDKRLYFGPVSGAPEKKTEV